MKKTNIIGGYALSGLFLILFLVLSSNAQMSLRKASGQSTNDLTVVMATFRLDLGGADNGIGSSHTSGRRELNWDDVPDNKASPLQFPHDYYNKTSPRGVVFNTSGKNLGGYPTMMVSIPYGDSPDYVSFKHSSANGNGGFLSGKFKPFSGKRVFGGMDSNHININFYIPGTDIPATVNGFGAVFTDVDTQGSITLYDESDKVVAYEFLPNSDNGFTFVGISFADGTRIARAELRLGSSPLRWHNGECHTMCDVYVDYVAMDNVIFGEPRAMEHHASDFDGDGGADLAVFRPSEGNWYVMNSGTNTFKILNFGLSGDIPADGDFDGDSRSDYTVFRPSTGTWYCRKSSDNQTQIFQFGLNGDKPVVADYDRDGKSDFAVWRPSDGNYYILRSSDNQVNITHWGASGDIPIGAGN